MPDGRPLSDREADAFDRRMVECERLMTDFERAITLLLRDYGATPDGLREHLEELLRA